MQKLSSSPHKSPERLETDRILSLPVIESPGPEDVEIESFEKLQAEAFNRGERLYPEQVAALHAYRQAGGALVPVPVGRGKTGTGLLIAQEALSTGAARKVLLLVPVQLAAGLFNRHVPEWRRRINLPAPFHYLQGRSRADRLRIAESGAPGVYVLPYSLLSTADSVAVLAGINADLVIADEVHRLKHMKSACTKRFAHFMRERDPKPRMVAMSGTLTRRSIMDYQHLAEMALHDKSPVPRTSSQAYSWSMVLDAGVSPPAGFTASTLGPILSWARTRFPGEAQSFEGTEGPRKAFRRRLNTAPGVVPPGVGWRTGVSLLVANRTPGRESERLRALETKVKDDGETPEGAPIAHAIHSYKWLQELSAGFYNSLVWPTPEAIAKNRKISLDEASDRLERAKAHLVLETEYQRELRKFLQGAPIGLDTPQEVGLALSRGADLGALPSLWEAMKEADFPGRPKRISIPVRVDDYKIRSAVEWVDEFGSEGAILWVVNPEIGLWLTEVLKDAVHCPAGADDLIESIGDPVRGGKGDRIVVASIAAHGTGRNLQAFRHQLFVQWPRSATVAEQTLGRLNRPGQQAEELVAYTLLGSEFDHVNRAATIADAIYVQSTTGVDQQILYADYDPLPKVYPPSFLRERGFRPLGDDRLMDKIKGRFGK